MDSPVTRTDCSRRDVMWRHLAVLSSVTLLGGLGFSCAGEPVPAPGEHFSIRGGAFEVPDVPVPKGSVLAFTVELATVQSDLELVSAEPVHRHGVDLLDTRFNFIDRADGSGWRTYPSGVCTRRWPPKGLGPMHPAANRELKRDDHVAFTVLARANAAGSIQGIRLHYRVDGRDHLQVSERGKLTLRIADDSPICSQPSGWFDNDIPIAPGLPPTSAVEGEYKPPSAGSVSR